MNEIIKEFQYLIHEKGINSEYAVKLMKIQELRRIGNMLSVIETDLSELVDIVREERDSIGAGETIGIAVGRD